MKKKLISMVLSFLIVFGITLPQSVVYAAEASTAIEASNVIVTNNVTGKADTVYIYGVTGNSLVKVYNAATGGKVIGYASVGSTKTEITISITQLGANAGSVWVSIVNYGRTESTRTQVNFAAEPQSDPLDASLVTVTNNAKGTADTIYIDCLAAGDIVKAYSLATGGKLLGTKTVGSTKTDATINVTNLGSTAGSVWVTVTHKLELESTRTEVSYAAPPTSEMISADQVTITNNVKKSDTIYVENLTGGSTIKVYNAATDGKLMTSKKISTSSYDATLSVSQLPNTGKVYITITCPGEEESARCEVAFDAEVQSTAISVSDVTITNNCGASDQVYVTGLDSSDVIKVYSAATKGTLLGSGTVPSTKYELTITIGQLGSGSATAYISRTSSGKLESARTPVSYDAEGETDSLSENQVTISNNAGSASDTVFVSGLNEGDKVKIYNAATKGTLLGSGTVGSSKTSVTITISQLGISSGTIYVSLTKSGCSESARLPISFEGEAVSGTISEDQVSVTNNAGKSDVIYVTNLSVGDVVKVYNSQTGATVLGTDTVAAGETQATITIAQLGSSAGSVYITVTSNDKIESSRLKVSYSAEGSSEGLTADEVTVTNNAGTSDVIDITGLTPADVVKIYDAVTGGSLLGSGTVGSTSYSIKITVPQLGTSAGTIYIAITSTNKKESSRLAVPYSAEGSSAAPSADEILVTNNVVGTADNVYVGGLKASDVVKVYDELRQGNILGTGTVSSTSNSVTISISQIGTAAGSVYVSVTSSGQLESSRTEVSYSGEASSTAPSSSNIAVTNNSGASDTVYVSGLVAKDIVKVYRATKGGTAIGTATVGTYDTSATVTISQLGGTAGTIYVSVTSDNKSESARTPVTYDAEPASGGVDAANVTIINNSGASDIITVTGLTAGDLIKVYSASLGGTVLGTATVSASSTDCTITVTQLGTAAGTVYITVTSENKVESSRTPVTYSGEGNSTAPSNIVVTNNSGAADTVYVGGLVSGDTVKVYDKATGGLVLGTKAVSGSYDTEVTVTISQLGSTAGSVWVTVTGTNKAESSRVQADYLAEPTSTAPSADNITVVNNSGASDSVRVSGLDATDVVKVYTAATGGTILGSGTVATNESEVIITISQIGSAAGSVYITVTSKNKAESIRTEKPYSGEGKSNGPAASNITVNNYSGAADTIRVTGLTGGDYVKVYDASTGGSVLGTGTAATYASEVTISISQLGTGSGSVYVSVTSTNKVESDRTQVDYSAEATSTAPTAANIVVTNNAGTSDTVYVSGLTAADIVKVYDAATGGTTLGTGTVASGGTDVTVTISQISTGAGTIYVTVTSTHKLESARTPANYTAESQSTAPVAANVTITNNASIASTILVTGLLDYDLVRVYDAAAGGNLLGSGTVAEYCSEVTVSVSSLSSSGGTVYITVTSDGKTESTRTPVTYTAKVVSDTISSSSVEVKNNASLADTVTVIGLDVGDIVKVYRNESGGTALGTATVAEGSMQAVVTITQLGTAAGTIYVTVTSRGKTESPRTQINYSAEGVSNAPVAGDVTIVNYSGAVDTITITGLTEGDAVKVYRVAEGGTAIAPATVAASGLSTVISISQLGTSAGSVYLTITSTGKTESARTKIDYAAESTPPTEAYIIIVNNAGISDTVTVSNLTENDVIKVYDASSGGNVLGSAMVSSGNTSATIAVSQLTSASGSIWVTNTNFGRAESSRTKATYLAEQATTAPYVGDIVVVNNADIDDTITVHSCLAGDVIKVYTASSGGTLLGYTTVATGKTSATLSVDQLSTTSGSVFVTLTTKGKTESSRTEAAYVSELQSTKLYEGDVTIVNNKTLSDTITVTGRSTSDIVKVYDSSVAGNLLGSATCSSSSTSVTITISQLGTSSGCVYISVTSLGKTESDRTTCYYVSEQTSNEVPEGNVTVVNNPTGTADTVKVAGLTSGDLIKVYDAASNGNLLGSATASSTTVTINITQLGIASGTIYITLTSSGKAESARTAINYCAE